MFDPTFCHRYEKFYRALAGISLTCTTITTLAAIACAWLAIAKGIPPLGIIAGMLALASLAGVALTRRHLTHASHWQSERQLATHGRPIPPMPTCTIDYHAAPH